MEHNDRRRPRDAARRCLAAFVLVALAACAEPPDERPNVLWISLDTLRADHLSCYGYARPSSPAIDRLASEGVLFENAYATAPWTLPSHVSMLTGLPVSAHGICDHQLWLYVDDRFELHGTFISEELQAAGYDTAGFYNWKYLEPDFGFGPGFDVWERVAHTPNSHPEVSPRWQAAIAAGDPAAVATLRDEYPEVFDESRPSTRRSLDRAMDWLGARQDGSSRRPFFLFLHLFDVHDPYTPPASFESSFADLQYEGEIDGLGISSPDSKVRPDMKSEDLEQLVALYDGEIAWVDAEIGRLLEHLRTLGLEEETLVVLTADHGEEFFEHGRKLHRSSLYREQLQVPMILRMPGKIAPGTRVKERVDLVDLVPTVHKLLGREVPASLPGRDLIAPDLAQRTLVGELTVLIDLDQPEWSVSLLRDHEHVIVHQPGSEDARAVRYDLATNPLEEGEGEPIALDSEEGLALLAELETVRTQMRMLRQQAQRREVGAPLSEEDLLELGALGYTTSDTGAKVDDAQPDVNRHRLCMDGCVWRRE